MTIIGILYHPKIVASQPLAAEIEAWLVQRGVSAWTASAWEEAAFSEALAGADFLLVLGGDGSTLHAARLALPYKIPIFGVNLGRVGFLSEARPDDWRDKLSKVIQGEYWIEERLMLHAALRRNGEIINTFSALNDLVIGRGRQARVLHLHLSVDGDHVTTYTADALIVSTPTGSTAYSMAAGGPLLPPQLQNFVVVPVAAHLSLDRALVLHEEAEITIQVQMGHEAMLTADGQDGIDLESADEVVIHKHENHSYFARVESSGYFYRRLMRRLGYLRPQSEG
ncbi:MAG: NAD(+)/NADH kinase [Ardenticatenaceae bacterium]|nr:NAD(+)/NADH kinase [Ardenticatenaceae bacterium]